MPIRLDRACVPLIARSYDLKKLDPFISQLAHLNFQAHLAPIPRLHFSTTDPPPWVARHLRLREFL